MLTKDEIIQVLKRQQPKIQNLGVSTLGLFGSYARNQQHQDSDIDLLVDFQADKYNYDNFINLCFMLDELFEGKKIEVVTKKSLSPYIGPKILQTVQYVF